MTQAFDVQALHAYLRQQGLCGTQTLHVSVLSGGQSNPTYHMQSGQTKMVLRKQPQGQLLAGAHAVDREYRVMKALQGSGVPVPQMLDYCEDREVLGTPFYVMAYLQGRVMMDQSLPGMTASERGAIYAEMVRVLALLHSLDHKALGLPTEQEYVHRYAQLTGRGQIHHWDFYMAYNLFRMAAILHGIAQRAHDGTANAPDAQEIGRKAQPLADLAWQCAVRGQRQH